jgi:DNA polymerase-3 subunit delta'
MSKSINEPILHPSTASLINEVIASPPNSLGLVGPSGIGRKTLAQWIIRNIVGDPDLILEANQYCKLIGTENNISIKIEQIKPILEFVKLKTAGKNNLRRFVIIEDADLLTDDAQNSLLQLLEEPPIDTMIILLIQNLQEILPTILSRLQIISVKKPSKEQIKSVFNIDSKEFDKLYVLADGLPGLLQAIIDDPDNHTLIISLDVVRGLLTKTTFERLTTVNELSTDKIATKNLLDVLTRLSKVSIDSAVKKGDEVAADKWLKILTGSVYAKAALNRNANAKLTLTDLFLNLV